MLGPGKTFDRNCQFLGILPILILVHPVLPILLIKRPVGTALIGSAEIPSPVRPQMIGDVGITGRESVDIIVGRTRKLCQQCRTQRRISYEYVPHVDFV